MNLGGTVRINRCGLIFIAAITLLIIFYAYGGNSNSVTNNSNASSNSLSASAVSASSSDLTSPADKVSLRKLLSAAIDIAKRGGIEVVDVRKSSATLDETIKGKTKEGVKDSATAGDYRSHRVMYYSLRKTFPGIKVISEEHDPSADIGDVILASTVNEEVEQYMKGDEIVNAEDVTVWIDPLDATKEYTENLIQYVTTMVGVALKGKPILGVIHRPFQDETYWAIVDHGHSPNLQLSDISNSKPKENQVLDKATSPFRIIVSRSHKGDVEEKTAKVLGTETPVKLEIAAGAGYKVLEVVKGNVDVYVHVTAIKKWDLCAGNAILDALGGKMTTVHGDLIDYSGHTEPMNTRGILGYLHDSELIEKLKKMEIPE
ncbi:putative inositol monophosphatase 3 [Orchesella cincta]|uniref:inositol-phosphate phosphatase n=1 Tax=Orchesella cincta TaxID=48709 RepID=A0A1D2NEC2_ORCCI|nr:putative inositol monophosphatase 3 [Orchesella cincta]